ncbi:PAS domain-containing sensor histidine kinase [Aureimonas populi]|uniref:histidine kinase n=1 Tax=Aureimonas populi TaxID=1701758 RepID=A0ABW5CIS7_9HYPH|nr:PAS domain-containing sensor histidine kinase [Aureimonas populi]
MALTTLDIMASQEVRAANEAARAVVVLTPDLEGVLFANSMGAVLLGLEGHGDAQTPTPLPAMGAGRRIRAVAPILEADGEAMLRLKGGAEGLEVWTTAHLLMDVIGPASPVALLTAPVPMHRPEKPVELAARLLAEARREPGAAVAVLSAEGTLAAAEEWPEEPGPDIAEALARFLQSDATHEREAESGLEFWRVGAGLAFARLSASAAPAEAEPAAATPVASLLTRWRDRQEAENQASEPGSDEEPDFAPSPLDGEPVRFVWQIDASGCFRALPAELAAVVGPLASDVEGVPFAEVARAYGFDQTGEIGRLLERRETFAGRTVLWPVQGTDRKVPVELAALPVYGRERVFEGFRGFGVVRPAESVADPEGIGQMLSSGLWEEADSPEETEALLEAFAREAQEPMVPELPFGRRSEPPGEEEAPARKRMDERRRARDLLSPAERDAFHAIGQELAPGAEAPAPAPREAAPGLPADALALLSAIPLPVLVELRGEIVFASEEFLDFTLYGNVEALRAAGGIDALFVEGSEGEDAPDLGLRRADGSQVRARVQMRRLTLSARSCLIFTFQPATPEPGEGDAEHLREEVEELRAVLDTATDGVLLLDPEGHIRSMNGSAEAMFGASEGNLEGAHFADLLAPESRRSARDYLDAMREEGLAGILNDGREVTAEVAGRGTIPLFVTVGRLSGERGWCVVLRDMAHWKQVEAELVAARRQAEDASLHKSRFLANISHELRTPLNAIIGFADVMVSETYGPLGHERYMEYLGDIKRSGHHVLDLVNDLLDISKIEAGKVEMAFEAVSLNEVVSEVVSLMQPQANRERVIVRSNLPADIPAVVADRRSLRQIALNLLSNAIRFTPSGGQIVASTSYGQDGEVALRFRDSGIGMTDREIEIALTPFQQVNSASKERGDGTGLGLPLTKAMVEANRAQFRIASTPGEGTLIEITFPAQRVLAH